MTLSRPFMLRSPEGFKGPEIHWLLRASPHERFVPSLTSANRSLVCGPTFKLMHHDLERTAVLLIGFQNDYFSDDGALYSVVEESVRNSHVLQSTLSFLDRVASYDALIVNLPLLFSSDYSELKNPTGLLATIRDLGAFRRGGRGGEVISEITAYGDRIIGLQGKTGFNGFLGTKLDQLLKAHDIQSVVVAGIVTSVCIDSTARAATELGYRTVLLSDCSAGKTQMEHEFYCENVFPLYAEITESTNWPGLDARAKAA